MTSLANLLLSLGWPIVRKVLVMLGIGVVTYGAMTTLLNSVIAQAQASWGQIAGVALQLSSLGGIPQVLGIITGAMVARVSFMVAGKLAILAK